MVRTGVDFSNATPGVAQTVPPTDRDEMSSFAKVNRLEKSRQGSPIRTLLDRRENVNRLELAPATNEGPHDYELNIELKKSVTIKPKVMQETRERSFALGAKSASVSASLPFAPLSDYFPASAN